MSWWHQVWREYGALPEIALVLLVLLSLIQLSLAAVLVRWKQAMQLRAVFELVPLNQIPIELRAQIDNLVHQFAVAGFQAGPLARVAAGMQGTTGLQMVLSNHQTGDVGVIIAAQAKHLQNLVFAIRSHFVDVPDLATVVNRSITYLPRDPKLDSLTFAWVGDVATLAEAHRRRIDRLGTARTRRAALLPGGEIAYMEAHWIQEIQRPIDCGYQFADGAAGLSRMTWKGAILGVLKLFGPIKAWRIRMRNMRSRRVWRDLGMDSWVPPLSYGVGAAPLRLQSSATPPRV